jgi:hypothetical protein
MKIKIISFAILFAMILLPVVSFAQVANAGAKSGSRMIYHNGPVMTGTSNVYMIWYGDWSGNTAKYILDFMIASLGGTSYFQINTTYPELSGAAPSGGLVYSGGVDDLYSHGNSLDQSDVDEIVTNSILTGQLPLDLRGIYIVLGALDVDMTGFVDGPCDLHGTVEVVGTQARYIFVPNSARYLNACASQFLGRNGELLPTPNNNLAADAMASWVAHGLNATVTNPQGNGWFDRSGLENSGKCEGTYGTTYTTPNGARANINLGGQNYLLQQNWINDRKGRCALSML